MPTTSDTPTASPASVLVIPCAIADQNNLRCSLRATGGRPGDRIGGLPVITAIQPAFRPLSHLSIEVLRRPVEPGQYTSIAFTIRLAEVGIDASVGSVGDAYDNALAESVIGLFKTELIKSRGPWRTVEQVEIASLELVDWFNHRRLFEACGDIPPAELEAAHYRQQAALTEVGHSTP